MRLFNVIVNVGVMTVVYGGTATKEVPMKHDLTKMAVDARTD